MKAKILTTICATMFSLSSIFANEIANSNNLDMTKTEMIKEYSVLRKESEKDGLKVVCEKNVHNQLLLKIVYLWNDRNGWIPSQKYEYDYSSLNDERPSSLSYARWNEGNGWGRLQKVEY